MRTGVRTAISLSLAAALITLWPSVSSLGRYWWEITGYQHGMLIAAMAIAWFVYLLLRAPLPASRFSWMHVMALAFVIVAWLVAYTANIDILHQLLLPVVLWLAVLCVTGWPGAQKYAWPIGLLYFAVPVWDYCLPLLQYMCVAVTEWSMRLLGVPTTIQENRVTIPEGTFEIVEGCSGVRYFMIGLAVAYVCSELLSIRRWRLVGFLLATGLLSLLANWIRIAIVIYAGHVTHMQSYLVAVEHLTLGNVIFVPLLLAIYWLGFHVFSAAPAGSAPSQTTSSAIGIQWRGFSAVLALLSTVYFVTRILPSTSAGSVRLGDLPLSTVGWQGPLPPSSAWHPVFVGASAETAASYVNAAGEVVDVYVNFYAAQAPGRELVGYVNGLIPALGWSRLWPRRQVQLVVAERPTLGAEVVRGPTGQNWLIVHIYRIGATVSPNDVVEQLAYGMGSILRPVPSGVVAFAIQCRVNCESAQRVAMDFWSQLSSQLLAVIPDSLRKDP